MNMKKSSRLSYRSMKILAVVTGIAGVALQFVEGFELLVFMLTVGVYGSLLGGSGSYPELDRRRLERSYKTALEWLLLAMLALYAWIEVSAWLGIMEGATAFLNEHWPGLILSVMCLIMGLAGLREAYPASEG